MRQEISRALRGTFQAKFHHGGCVGSDCEAHAAAWSMGYGIVLHPPTDTKLRAWVEQSDLWDVDTDIVLPERPYIERNHDIVDAVTLLIATPDGPERNSGTWATIRYARTKGVPTVVVMPDGSIA
jgi:hypothetical protein